jgi:hypothetical protein
MLNRRYAEITATKDDNNKRSHRLALNQMMLVSRPACPHLTWKPSIVQPVAENTGLTGPSSPWRGSPGTHMMPMIVSAAFEHVSWTLVKLTWLKA